MAKRRRRKDKQNGLQGFAILALDGYALFKRNYGRNISRPATKVKVSRSNIWITNDKTGASASMQRSANAEIIEFVSKNLRSKQRVLIEIDDNSFLNITEPIATSLERLCEEQAIRITLANSPFPTDQTLYFWDIIPTIDTQYELRVNIMPKTLVEDILFGIRNIGASIEGISRLPRNSEQVPISRPSWLIEKPKSASQFQLADLFVELRSLPTAYSLSVTILALFFVMTAANIIFSNYRLGQSEAASTQARQQLANLASAGRLSQTTKQMTDEAILRINLMDHLAEGLDNGSWVTRYRIDEQAAEISITSQSAADVLRKISEFERVQNVRLLTTVTRDPENNLERFTIGLDLQ